MRQLVVALAAGLVALSGSLAAILSLEHVARRSVEHLLEERLRGAGESAALLVRGAPQDAPKLQALMNANKLDGVYEVDRTLNLLADASGVSGGKVDILRVEPERLEAAFRGQSSVALGYALGPLHIQSAYFPIRSLEGPVQAVLVLEAGETFLAARTGLRQAVGWGFLLSGLGAAVLASLAALYARAERRRREETARAARGETMGRMAAMAAHEIRNPLGVIRATVDLMRERVGAHLTERDRSALADVLSEVERLRRLTEDFLDLATDRSLAVGRAPLGEILASAAQACSVQHPGIRILLKMESLPAVMGDPERLRQVFMNLFTNAAQAHPEGEITVSGEASANHIRLLVRDQGKGLDPELRGRLFDPFVTTKTGGTGLGLALSRRIVERHSGTLRYVDDGKPGAAFEVRLPLLRSEA